MAKRISPLLMFDGMAEDAVQFYVSVFADLEVVDLERYSADDGVLAGLMKRCILQIGELSFIVIDSPVKHEFSFTPAFSLHIECVDEQEIEGLYEHLAQQGKILMPLNNHGFSRLFAWVNDRYGVSWQLNLT